MARRRIGQEQLAMGSANARGCDNLDEMPALIDWTEINRCLAGIYTAAKGEPAWPRPRGLSAVLRLLND